jgi:alpha-tubulin suppressor-like RCC1 family protein
MALNLSGPISLGGSTVGQSVNLEIGVSATAQVSFNDAAVRTLTATTAGTALVMPTDFYGKSQPTSIKLFMWGNPTSGGLGLGGPLAEKSSPTQVGTGTDWQSADSSGREWTVAIKTNGQLWAWGKNNLGQLGQGNTTDTSSPVQVGALTNWAAVAAGNYHCIAVKTDGTLWSWGQNTSGELGLGDTSNRSSPVQIGSATNWLYPGGATANSFCIKTDGTLWSWGSNGAGGLGTGNTTPRSSPLQVGSDTNWSKIKGTYASQSSVMALKTNGELFGWGQGFNGRLGRGNLTYYSSPVQVGAGSTWLDIVSGSYHTVLVKSDNTLWATGWNLYGQLGLGDTTSRSSLTQVGSLTTWKFARAGYNNSFAVTTSNQLYAWGANFSGSLGLGDTTDRSSPVQVGALTTWLAISAGMYNKTLGLVG